MVKVYGMSDDLCEIEGSVYREDEIDCYERDVKIYFDDGTIIRVGYPKEAAGIWWIKVERQGTATQTLTVCNDEDAMPYSDVFEIDAEIKRHFVFSSDDCQGEKIINLEPCPFCGRPPTIVESEEPRLHRPLMDHPYYIRCNSCDLLFGYDVNYGGQFDSRWEAAKVWNNRRANI